MAVANSLKLSRGNEAGWPPVNAEQAVANMTFDCVLHFETQLPTGTTNLSGECNEHEKMSVWFFFSFFRYDCYE